VSPDRIADGPVPLSPGISPQLTGTEYSVLAHALPAFDSTWLPTAYPASRVVALGDWRWDPATMDFAAAGDTNASDESYSMGTVDLDYGTTGRFFRDPPAGSYPEEDVYVPATVSAFARRLAERVTAGATTNYQRARLLQAFFRSTGHFTYSIHNAPVGTDGQVLDTFLRDGPGGRIGFCQQFASAMAILARVVGIPARVAVGFLTPQRLGPRDYQYSSHDLHAWTELYFAGAGWVRFDATPAVRVPTEPAYSTVPVDLPDNSGTGPGRSHLHPGTGPTQQPSSNPGSSVPSYETPVAQQGGPGATHGHGVAWVLGGLLVLLVVVALLTSARVVRRRRRALRLAGDPEAVWSEVRATAVDLAIPWPDGRSPRQRGRLLAAHLVADGRRADLEVLAAVNDLVLSLEEYRYGSEGRSVAVAARTDVGTRGAVVVAALEATATRGQRRRARWLPRSLSR
jgi:transglutaminase-like putative cysteine protease